MKKAFGDFLGCLLFATPLMILYYMAFPPQDNISMIVGFTSMVISGAAINFLPLFWRRVDK